MKRNLLLFCLINLTILNNLQAQIMGPSDAVSDIPFRNTLFAELGGNADGLTTINFEKLFPRSSPLDRTYVLQIGCGHNIGKKGYFLSSPSFRYIIFPVDVSMFWGRKLVKPELGAGVTFKKYVSKPHYYSENLDIIPVLNFGIRFQNTQSHFFGKFGFTTCFVPPGTDQTSYIITLPRISIGYQFGR